MRKGTLRGDKRWVSTRVGALMFSGSVIRSVRGAISPRLSLCATLLAALFAGSSVADAGVMFGEDGGAALTVDLSDVMSDAAPAASIDLAGSQPGEDEDGDQTPVE